MKAREQDKLAALRLLLSEVKRREVDERITLDDAGVVAVVEKMLKQRKDSISQFAAAGRQDLADKESAEVVVLEGYLPQRLDAAQIAAEVRALVDALAAELGRAPGPGEMGRVMGAAKAKLAGIADMGAVSQAVKQALAK